MEITGGRISVGEYWRRRGLLEMTSAPVDGKAMTELVARIRLLATEPILLSFDLAEFQRIECGLTWRVSRQMCLVSTFASRSSMNRWELEWLTKVGMMYAIGRLSGIVQMCTRSYSTRKGVKRFTVDVEFLNASDAYTTSISKVAEGIHLEVGATKLSTKETLLLPRGWPFGLPRSLYVK